VWEAVLLYFIHSGVGARLSLWRGDDKYIFLLSKRQLYLQLYCRWRQLYYLL